MFPNLYVDDTLEQQLDRLAMYEAKWDEKKQIFTKPIHNEFSHLADAMRYCATTYKNKTAIIPHYEAFTVDY
jgi:phage terminase large subunit